MTSTDSKNTMRIAMVGISPADQITFKGYLRVLLRLDVDLDWVSAQVNDVDLYVINQDFKDSASVQKLIDAHPRTPILYLCRNLAGDGGITDDLLVLPLKQINNLNQWLHQKVSVLKGLAYQTPSTSKTPIKTAQTAESTQTAQQAQPATAKMNDLIELVKTLHTRPKSLFELTQDGEVLAVIDGARQLVWLKSAKVADVTAWRLRVYGGMAGESKHAIDMNQWLYQIAWVNSDKLLPLINPQAHHQLRSWAKPDNNADRRIILRTMVALEDTARTVDEIVVRTGLSRLIVQKVIASLLFSQHLTDNSYQNISTTITPVPTVPAPTAPVAKPISASEPKPEPKTTEQQEKLGFLSRLRRKLGL